MKQAYSVLVIGPSSVPYTESGDDGKLASLLKTELEHSRPEVRWTAEGVLVYEGPGMVDRVRRAVEAHRPDVLFLRLTNYHFKHEYVLWAVRNRWPRLYPAARFVDKRLKWLAGGPRDLATTPRPWVYTLPRLLAESALGSDIRNTPDVAAATVNEAIDYLLSREALHLYVYTGKSARNPRDYGNEKHQRDVRAFWDPIIEHCEARSVPLFDSAEVRAWTGQEKRRSIDGVHSDLENRRGQARYLAMRTLEALEIPVLEGAHQQPSLA